MEQIAFKFHSDEIEISYIHGAMYAYAPGIPFDAVDIELGDKILKPGEFIHKMGEKARTSFEMEQGYYLRYVGKSGDYILFSVNDLISDYYYAFGYVNKNTLVITGRGKGRDVRLNTLEVFTDFRQLK